MTRNNRKRSNSASPDPDIVKTPKLVNDDITVGIMKLIDSKFKELNEAINAKIELVSNKIETFKSEILAQIGIQINELRNEYKTIANKVEQLEVKMKENEYFRTELDGLKERTDKLDNVAISAELRINGIPSNKNENLFEIFKLICTSLQITTPNIHSIFRIRNNGNSRYNDAPIILKLASPYERNFLMRSFALFRRQNRCCLTLEHIGLNSKEPIYLNENLTKTNSIIMKTATKYKKDGKLNAAYSLRGLVFVKIPNNDTPLLIKSVNMLEELISADRDFRNVGNQNNNS